jgi:AcrR family transcriptional regulator
MSKNVTNRQLEIIEAAGKLLTYSGIGSLTIKNIAKEMKFTESAIYRHFSSKEEIVKGMLDYLSKEMDERYQNTLFSNHLPIDNLKLIFTSQIDFFIAKPFFVGAIFPDGLWGENKIINEAILQLMETRKRYLIPILENCLETKVIKNDLSAEDLSHLMMGSFRLLVLKWRLKNFDFDFFTKGNELITNILKLITI